MGARNQDSAEIRRGEAGLDHGTAAALAVFWLELEADRLKIDARSNREARAALLSKSSTQTSQMYAYTCESCTDLLRHVECKVAAALAHVVTKPVCVACARAGRRSQHVNLRARGNLLDVCTRGDACHHAWCIRVNVTHFEHVAKCVTFTCVHHLL